MSKADLSEELEGLLEDVLQDKSKLDALSAQLGIKKTEG
jgi:type VI secretion system protein ImpB